VEGVLASQDPAILADLDRLLLAHIVPEQPYIIPNVYMYARGPLRTASLQHDDLDVFTVGTWP
jgi:hypothetical protein